MVQYIMMFKYIFEHNCIIFSIFVGGSVQFLFYYSRPIYIRVISITYLQNQNLMSHTIRISQEVEDLETVFSQYFSNPQGAGLAVWLLANKEMLVDGVAKYASPFRNNQKKQEFQTRDFDYTHYKLRNTEDSSDEAREMGTEPMNNFLALFKVEFAGRLDGLGQPSKFLLRTGIQEELNNLLFDLKSQQAGNGEQAYVEPKTEYLKQLIEKIVEKLYKENEEGIAEKIIAYGGIQPVLTAPLFSDQSFRIRFKNILYNCKTFSELKLYGGKNIVEEKNKLIESISTCLISLKFNEKTAQQICDELLDKPLSNTVALREDLTNKQKESYYNSAFYRSYELKTFAQIRDYAQSLEYKVKEDVTKILSEIEEWAKNSRETIENVLAFNFYGLLKIDSIKHIKDKVYKSVIANCPDFFKAFKMIKYQGKTPASLKENERINQKMDLIDLFFKIKLPFEEWDKAETKILSRDYTAIEDLTLKFQAKHKLLQHIIKKVEPYFRKGEKEMDYRSEVEHALLELLMKTEIAEGKFETILNIISETLDSEDYTSQTVNELAKGHIRMYNEVLKKCSSFKQYVTNKRRDVKEEEYQKSWELRQQIYEINLEDRIDVSYEAIDQFIKKIIQDGGRIPKSYPQHITDLSKLRGDPIEPIVEEKEDPPSPQQSSRMEKEEPVESKEELNKRFAATADKWVKAYINENEDSSFEKIYLEKFNKNNVNFIKRIVETNAFRNEGSAFFSELGLNNFFSKKLKAEFTKNAGFVSVYIDECQKILQKLAQPSNSSKNSGASSPVKLGPSAGESKEEINKKFIETAEKLIKAYINDNEDSMLEKMYVEKFGKNATNFIRKVVETRAFRDQESTFFTELALNNFQTKKIKAEFAKNAVSVLADLDECSALLQRLV